MLARILLVVVAICAQDADARSTRLYALSDVLANAELAFVGRITRGECQQEGCLGGLRDYSIACVEAAVGPCRPGGASGPTLAALCVGCDYLFVEAVDKGGKRTRWNFRVVPGSDGTRVLLGGIRADNVEVRTSRDEQGNQYRYARLCEVQQRLGVERKCETR